MAYRVLSPSALNTRSRSTTGYYRATPVVSSPMASFTLSEEAVKGAMRGVIDPQLRDNVVDLGMYRGADIGDGGGVAAHAALPAAGRPLRAQPQRHHPDPGRGQTRRPDVQGR